MTMQYRLIPVAIAMSAILSAAPALGAGPNGRQPAQPVLSELDPGEVATLVFMREEERVARDVYLNMDALWQLLPFENIAASEQKHMDAIKGAMDKYGLADPSDPNDIGIYFDDALQQLYTDLIDLGDDSYIAALQVGALIEEVDIDDLEVAIAATDNADLQTIYGNLLRGSRNHLRAFVAEIERRGVVYVAQHLTQDAVDAIIDTPMERGGRADGKGAGSKRLGMAEGMADQASLTLGLDRLIARNGNGSGNGGGSKTRKGGGSGDCKA
ncbi:hypothetical protein CCR95_07490 [Thiocystis minor]|uniref:DUF2202 domain-containing protein n=1 Tax=Thiocystis minor TaxID=61597 RepID=UPI001913CBDE|nr:DUF2202 domain-containing protein [Thiocystis minor]MBK5963932.1 hypothetical protein [Thiocystis minor]